MSSSVDLDFERATSGSFVVLTLHLDDGPVHLGERAARLGSDVVLPGILRPPSPRGAFVLAEDALPGLVVNRRAEVRFALDGLPSLDAAPVEASGVVDEEPSGDGSGSISLTIVPPRYRPQYEPPGNPITLADYPHAPDDSVGRYLPSVFGTVERAQLIPVQLPALASLTETAGPGDRQLVVSDATPFPASGTVRIDGRTYGYTSRTDTALLGMSVQDAHRTGTTVFEAINSVFRAAGHAVEAISEVRSGDTILSGYSTDLAQASVTFEEPPQTELEGQDEFVEIEFDQVGAGNTAQGADRAIKFVSGSVFQAAGITSGSYAISVPIQYEEGDQDRWKPLFTSITFPPATAGTYTFRVYLTPPVAPVILDPTGIRIGTATVNLGTTTPDYLELAVSLSGGQTSVDVTHSNGGAEIPWPTSWINKNAASLITRIEAGITATPGLPTGIIESGQILFPETADPVITGSYEVTFSVAAMPSFARGTALLRIGGQVVYAYQDGAVLLNDNPVSLILEGDRRTVDVAWVLTGFLTGDFIANITSASRNATLGRLDDSLYSVISPGEVFEVLQTTRNPNRGRINRARLVVEHFTTATEITGTSVSFGGQELGLLTTENEGGGGSQTITLQTDTVGLVGAPRLVSRNVGGIVSNPASFSNDLDAIQVLANPSYTVVPPTDPTKNSTEYAPLRTIVGLPPGVIPQTVTGFMKISEQPPGFIVPTGNSIVAIQGGLVTTGRNYGQIAQFSITLSANQSSFTVRHYAFFNSSVGPTIGAPVIESLWLTVQRSTDLAVGGGGYSGSPLVSNDSVSVPLAGTGFTSIQETGTNQISIDAAPPSRTVFNVFALNLSSWDDLTNKRLRITSTDSETVAVVRAYVEVEYTPLRATSEGYRSLTATVQGRDENPAAVLEYLYSITGTAADTYWLDRLRTWGAAYPLSRRIGEPTDVAVLIQFLAEQVNGFPTETADGSAVIRFLDPADEVEVSEEDLLAPSGFKNASLEEIVNSARINYREVLGDWSRVLEILPTGKNARAVYSYRDTNNFEARREIDLGWVSNDAVASRFASDFLRLNAPIYRTRQATLPHTFTRSLYVGALTRYKGDGRLYRVVASELSGAQLTIQLREVPE